MNYKIFISDRFEKSKFEIYLLEELKLHNVISVDISTFTEYDDKSRVSIKFIDDQPPVDSIKCYTWVTHINSDLEMVTPPTSQMTDFAERLIQCINSFKRNYAIEKVIDINLD